MTLPECMAIGLAVMDAILLSRAYVRLPSRDHDRASSRAK